MRRKISDTKITSYDIISMIARAFLYIKTISLIDFFFVTQKMSLKMVKN
jgi:hypothetical protein